MKQTLEEKQAEKQRLSKAYKARKRAQWVALFQQEPRLAEFKRTIRRHCDPAATLLLLADSWVRFASDDIRLAALRIIDAHANRMARFAGGEALSDPLEGRNVFMAAKEMLAVR